MACIGFGGAALAMGALTALYVAVLWIRLPAVSGLGERGDPGPTAFMATDGCAAHQRVWRDLDAIDPRIGCAVIHTEDRHFFTHDGVDLGALRTSMRRNWDEGALIYGGSTITMQLARNLFLSPRRTFSRKLAEIFLARRLTDTYDRLRLLEIYLNSAELAPCIYGVEAAARHYFGHGAAILEPAEVAFLASMLPRPQSPPGFDRADRLGLIRRQKRILRRLWHAGLLLEPQLLRALNQLEARWRSGWHKRHLQEVRPAPKLWYDRSCVTR
jgi:membrane peptidoglycan carboxypeptidase